MSDRARRALVTGASAGIGSACAEELHAAGWAARGQPVGNITLVTSNAAGQAQHVVGNYRPRSTLLLLSRLVGEKLAGTPYCEHFATSQS